MEIGRWGLVRKKDISYLFKKYFYCLEREGERNMGVRA